MYKTDWSKIYRTEFISVSECWKTCGGYCCNNFFGDYLKILDKNSVSLPMTEDEFCYYESIGGISNITSTPKNREFILKNGKKFKIYFLSCSCKGLCKPHSARPLICRIYPYFPIVNAQGQILDYDYCAIMDIFYTSPKIHRCSLINNSDLNEKIKAQLNFLLPEMLKDPFQIFVFMMIKLFIDSFREAMGEKIDKIDHCQIGSFIGKFEKILLLGKPWKTNYFQTKIIETYEEIKNVWKEDFL